MTAIIDSENQCGVLAPERRRQLSDNGMEKAIEEVQALFEPIPHKVGESPSTTRRIRQENEKRYIAKTVLSAYFGISSNDPEMDEDELWNDYKKYKNEHQKSKLSLEEEIENSRAWTAFDNMRKNPDGYNRRTSKRIRRNFDKMSRPDKIALLFGAPKMDAPIVERDIDDDCELG